MIHPVVAIDGPAASGKSTVARKLAARLNYTYVDTGAMYRSFAWIALEKNIPVDSREAIKKLITEIKFETVIVNNAVELRLDGIDPAPFIRDQRINQSVSKIAAIPELREFLVNKQRQLRALAPLVMEGRDIGTVVVSDTPYKYFLDADEAVRNQRRQLQGQVDSLKERDALDRNRASAPLIKAADAEKVDSSTMNADEIVDLIIGKLQKQGLKNAK